MKKCHNHLHDMTPENSFFPKSNPRAMPRCRICLAARARNLREDEKKRDLANREIIKNMKDF